jgi:hypothetical protein
MTLDETLVDLLAIINKYNYKKGWVGSTVYINSELFI